MATGADNPYGFIPFTRNEILTNMSPDELELYKSSHEDVQERIINKALRSQRSDWNLSNPDKFIADFSGVSGYQPPDIGDWGEGTLLGDAVANTPSQPFEYPENPGLFGKEDGFGSGKGWLARTFGAEPGNLVEGIDPSGIDTSIGGEMPGMDGAPGTGGGLLGLPGTQDPYSLDETWDEDIVIDETEMPNFDKTLSSLEGDERAEDRFLSGQHVFNRDKREFLKNKYPDKQTAWDRGVDDLHSGLQDVGDRITTRISDIGDKFSSWGDKMAENRATRRKNRADRRAERARIRAERLSDKNWAKTSKYSDFIPEGTMNEDIFKGMTTDEQSDYLKSLRKERRDHFKPTRKKAWGDLFSGITKLGALKHAIDKKDPHALSILPSDGGLGDIAKYYMFKKFGTPQDGYRDE